MNQYGQEYENLIRHENGIKTKDLKFVKPQGEDSSAIRKGILRDPGYNSLLASYVDLHTTDGHILKTNFQIQIDVETKAVLGKNHSTLTFPIKLL